MARLHIFIYLLIGVCLCEKKMQLTPDEAAKQLRREASKDFNTDLDNFLESPVEVQKVVSKDQNTKDDAAGLKNIKKELYRVWRELHSTTSQLEHHKVLSKDTASDDSERNNDNTDTKEVTVKTSEEKGGQTVTSQENSLREKSTKMEKLEKVVDNLLRELQTDDESNSQKQEKKSTGREADKLQNEIDQLSKLSREVEQANPVKRQKLNGIGREVNHVDVKSRANENEDSRYARVAPLMSLLGGSNQMKVGDDQPPKFNGIGREISKSKILKQLLENYLAKRADREGLKKAPPMIHMDNGISLARQQAILNAVKKLMDRKRKQHYFTEKENNRKDASLGNTAAKASENSFDKLVRTLLTPPMIHMDGKKKIPNDNTGRKIVLLKRVLALLKEDSAPVFRKSKENDRRSELKESVENIDPKRREIVHRLVKMYKRLRASEEDNMARELALLEREKFLIDPSRFTRNRIRNGKSMKDKNVATDNGLGNKAAIVRNLKRLLGLAGNGVSKQTANTLHGFRKDLQREALPPPTHRSVSKETSESLPGFS